MASSSASNPPIITLPRRPFALPRAALPPRRFSQCSAIHRNSQAAWEHDSQGLGTRFPRAGNTIPKGWEHDSQGLGIRFPRAGNMIPSGREFCSRCAGNFSMRWYIECRPLVHRVPAAGTSSASRWYIECRPRVLQLPAAGTSIAGRGQFNCQPRAMRLPAAGNAIASPWQCDCQARW